MTDRPHILLAHPPQDPEAADLPAGIRESGAPVRGRGGQVGGVVAEPLSPHRPERAGLPHSVPHLTGSLKVFCHERVNVTDGRRYRLSSSFIRSQFKHRRRLRRASHVRQMRMTW